jgi:hypothetical protein
MANNWCIPENILNKEETELAYALLKQIDKGQLTDGKIKQMIMDK